MSAGVVKRDRCRLCDSKNLDLAVPMPATAIADAYVAPDQVTQAQAVYPLDLYFCRTCSHVQLLDVVDPRLMFRSDYTYLSGSSAGIVKHFRDYAASLLRREEPASGSLIVDIGSNDGTFLLNFKEAGLMVLGVDPATAVARRATEAGIETWARFLDHTTAQEVRVQKGAARIVTANNVFAHADDLGGMADSIRALLSPDGLFAFEVSYVVDVIDHMLLGTIFHEHLSYHAVKPLRAFLARHGLELVDIERVGIQGGSIIGYAQLSGGPRQVSSRVLELVKMEEERRFAQLDTYLAFNRRIDQMKQEVGALLDTLGPKGAGYGAARGGTALLYRLDLGRRLEFIVDDGPEKQGLFSPGHHIPIVSADTLYQRRPDWVFLLAWVHSKAILQKHARYMDEGGRFVVAYPDVRAVGAPTPKAV
jgi:hypothetical protein